MLSRVRSWTVQSASVFHTAVIAIWVPVQLYTSNMGVVPLAAAIVLAAIALLAASCLVVGGRPVTPDRDDGFQDGNHFAGERDEYISGYRSQVAFINARLRDVVESIKARAGLEPVIIVQSDHGPGSGLNWESSAGTDMTERSGILSAYYLPGGGTDLLYNSISPVNTFRVVFNAYFGGTYPMQPDRSSFSTWSAPYEFIDVTEPAATR